MIEPANNVLHVIMPYKWNGIWVFDDKERGLVREALISGADALLEAATEHIADRDQGVVVVFSDRPFPTHTLALTWQGGDENGHGTYYYAQKYRQRAWLCPALLLYFPEPPMKIYAMFTAKPKPDTQPQRTRR